MDYKQAKLSDGEMAILSIVAELGPTTGYAIGKVIEQRGYREWANIGKTSLYASVKKLARRGYLTSRQERKKEGKGPPPNLLALTRSGEAALMNAIESALLAQKDLPRYYLGIAAIRLLPRPVAVTTLRQRATINRQVIEEIGRIYLRQGGKRLPLEAKALFDHPVALIEADCRFLDTFIPQLKSEAMEKIDYKKELKELYGGKPQAMKIVKVSAMNFLMIDGEGDPNSCAAFSDAVESLFSLAYTIKFTIKGEQAIDYGVMPLEALWWTEGAGVFDAKHKDTWKWTVMIMQPKIVTKTIVNRCLAEVKKKKELAGLDMVRLEKFNEGLSAQVMYVGPYADEAPTIEKLHTFALEEGYQLTGKHHEIYLSDPRRAKPEKLKTIIRQPVDK